MGQLFGVLELRCSGDVYCDAFLESESLLNK